jgi:CNT family concentrative nucleoside transporter
LTGIAAGAEAVINSTNAGITFMFGPLVSERMFELFAGNGFVFALRVLPIIVFFASLMAMLYYLGVMQWIIRVFGGALHRALGTSRTESMSAAANVFVGLTEAPLVVKPYVSRMTRSELFAVMSCGLASVAGSVLVGYAALGVDLNFLVAASFMAAPGGLLMAKLLEPETDTPRDRAEDVTEEDEFQEDQPVNVIDAAALGAASGLRLALNVGGMLIAFIALIALFNTIVGGLGGMMGIAGLTIQQILGYLFAPVAFLLGIPWAEAAQAGSYMGQKLVINEFVAYVDFIATGQALSEHSRAVVTVALCGFANFSTLAILLGGLGVMAPSRRPEIARLGLKAVLAGTLSNFMSAALMGLCLSLAGG